MAREYARLRERNQLTLPAEVVARMGLVLGDIVEFGVSSDGKIELRPAKIVSVGSPEALRQERAAQEEIAQGRFTAIESVDDFRQHMDRVRKNGAPEESQPEKEVIHLTADQRAEVETVVQKVIKRILSSLPDSKPVAAKHEEVPEERQAMR
jgi:AbrB family looped-hinge helix DNA binding protein